MSHNKIQEKLEAFVKKSPEISSICAVDNDLMGGFKILCQTQGIDTIGEGVEKAIALYMLVHTFTADERSIFNQLVAMADQRLDIG